MANREEWIKSKKPNYENSLSDIIYSVIKPSLDSNSKLEATLMLNWHKIFDANMASIITFKKMVITDKASGKFILHVSVLPRNFLEATHSTEIMIEQLAVYLGYKACEKIMISKVEKPVV